MTEFDIISKILETGSRDEKIKTLESLANTKEPQVINLIISKLDDVDIQVRGEAFSSLVLNENEISDHLIANLNSENKNIRAFSALVLANRQSKKGIPSIIPLTKDESSIVRTCALGALGYLKATQASKEIHDCFSDNSLEVRKSALKAAIDIGEKLPEKIINDFKNENDPELDKILTLALGKSKF